MTALIYKELTKNTDKGETSNVTNKDNRPTSSFTTQPWFKFNFNFKVN